MDSAMQWDTLAALAVFAVAASWTPGPNNILLAGSGANFGLKRTTPHALGVALGFPVMLFLVCLGLGQVFKASDLLREGLRWAGTGLLLYLAWRISSAGRQDATAGARPFSFLEAAGFQWINPKAWTMAIGVAATYLDADQLASQTLVAAVVFVASGLGSAFGWAFFGSRLRRFLDRPGRLRAFNVVMGALLALCAVALFLDR
jgi:threonine/homoserine/homoserine lactone efflux protein